MNIVILAMPNEYFNVCAPLEKYKSAIGGFTINLLSAPLI
jgi:hypothetical protein